MKKLLILLVVALLVVSLAVPALGGGKQLSDSNDDEIQALYQQMAEIRKKIAEKRGDPLPPNWNEENYQEMYEYCDRMMQDYGYGMHGMMGRH